MDLQEELSDMKAKLDRVSPSFCLAKWLQVTIHLQNGFNHSCHHPNVHKTPLEELARDPSALHNTEYKKSLRAMMLRGERPSECGYCWKVEDTPGQHFSDRVLKSSDQWARPQLNEISRCDPSKNINPSYVEVSFGNECNFRCSYCGPQISSAIWSSYEKHGPYVGRPSLSQLREEGLAPLETKDNPYVRAFWEWFPSLAPDLKVFRITGGEPLVNPNTFRVLDYIGNHPMPGLQLCINSNFGVPEHHFRKFLDKLKQLTDEKKIGDFMMYTSIDTHGAQAEYLRIGLDYDLWLQRVRTYLAEVPWNLTFMATFNSLSVPKFPKLLDDLVAINRDFQIHKPAGTYKRTHLDISHLTHPDYFSAGILNPRWVGEIRGLVEQMKRDSDINLGAAGFYEYETHKMERIASWAETAAAGMADPSVPRALFAIFVRQHEEREGLRFSEVFPEMLDFLECCESALISMGDKFLQDHISQFPPEANGP